MRKENPNLMPKKLIINSLVKITLYSLYIMLSKKYLFMYKKYYLSIIQHEQVTIKEFT